MRAIIAIAAIALAGCASTQAVLDKPAKHVVQSDKPASEIVFCLSNKTNITPLTQADGSNLFLIKNNYGAVGAAITVTPAGDGSRVEYRKQFATFGTWWRECAGVADDGG